MDFSAIFFGILFIAVGILFAMGKLHVRLSAWKNMSDGEKDAIRIQPLVRNIGSMILLCGVLFLLKSARIGFGGKGFVAAMIIWLIVAGIDVWYISKSKRYQGK